MKTMLLARSLALSLILIGALSCSSGGSSPTSGQGDTWNIPADEVISGGVPQDGIPSLFDPEVISAQTATFLDDDELVVGLVVDGQARAYPHAILDWHEVVNESFSGSKLLTLTYCPLTGTAIAFDGRNGGRNLTFGVSGLLYNNNLIMFDRQTDSRWPQMRLQSDNGKLRNAPQVFYPTLETTWGNWKTLFPNTVVLSTNTGFSRPYGTAGSAYPGYTNLNSPPLFRRSVSFVDTRLPTKQRVHGILVGGGPDFQSKVYPILASAPVRVINDEAAGLPVLVLDAGRVNFMISFERTLDGQLLSFTLPDSAATFPFTFQDNETGTTWNVLGEATSGPLAGKRLEQTRSFNAYWFAWGTFYLGSEIFGQ